MGDDGGAAEVTLACERDGVPTQLRCVECQAPICPACFVRTGVGLRCQNCGVASGPPVRDPEARPRWMVPVAVAVVALGLAATMWLSGGRGPEEPVADLGGPPAQATAVEKVRLGTGDLPVGGWVLEARRNGEICATFSITPSPPAREQCRPLPAAQDIAFTSTRHMMFSSESFYVTWGLVTERTERVRVEPEGSTPWEVPAMGAGTGLGGRFFVAHTSSSVTTFVALASDGTELNRVRSAPPGS